MANDLIVANREIVSLSINDTGIQEIINRRENVKRVMAMAMTEVSSADMKKGKKGHYGTIPGCNGKVLLKPGAELLCSVFHLTPKYNQSIEELPNSHRQYEFVCSLYTMGSNIFLGEGVGMCSTMETKYRYTTGPCESTGKPVPKNYWDTRDVKLLGGVGLIAKKDEDTGKYMIFRRGERVEDANPADKYNTVKKMGKKRALVDAVLTVLAASDVFDQDLADKYYADLDVADVTLLPPRGKPPMEPPKEKEDKSGDKTSPGNKSQTPAMASTKQCGAIHGLMDEMMGKDDTPENVKHQYVAALLGKDDLESYKTLTMREAYDVVAKLKKESEQK